MRCQFYNLVNITSPLKTQDNNIPFFVSVIQTNGLTVDRSVGIVPTLITQATLGTDVEMVQGESAGGDDGLITPRRLPNPCLENSLRMDLHRELLFNQRM